MFEPFLGPTVPFDIAATIIEAKPNGQGGYAGDMIHQSCAPASVVAYGPGCGGITPLAIETDDSPMLGQTMAIRYPSIPQGSTPAAFLMGHSQALLSLGGSTPGCVLLTSAEYVLLTPALLGGVYADFHIGADPVLIGAPLTLQGVALAPGANPLGVILSNGLAMTLGEF
ncbi:MAG: hypothetical protein AAF628_30515 [Planctomycetota bacterium]